MKTFKIETSLQVNELLKDTNYYNNVGDFINDLEKLIKEEINENNILDFFNTDIYYLPFLVEALINWNYYHELDIIRATLIKNKLNLPNDLKMFEMIKIISLMQLELDIDILDYNFFN